MNKHIVCINSNSYDSYDPIWKKSGLEYEYLNDVSKQDKGEGLKYTEADVRRIFNFKDNVSKYHYWNSFGNRNIIWFYAHLRMIYYYHKNPQYDYYWFYDDDIRADNWELFHDGFKNNPSDFISFFCFKNVNVTSQPTIPVLDENTTSKEMWFRRFPGNGDRVPEDIRDFFGSFFPIVRISNAAIRKLYELWKNNHIYGYSEGFVPTVLNHYGFSLDTIYNKESQSLHFDDNIVNVKHKGIKITWQWI